MEQLKRITKKIDRYKFLLLAGLAGMLLLVWPFDKSTEKSAEQSKAACEDVLFDISGCEERLEALLGEIQGVGRVRVMLTLESDMETIFAIDNESQTEYEPGEENNILREVVKESYVIIKSADEPETPITRKVIYPKFKGAVIVCDGGDEAGVQLKVLRSVSSLTGLTADRISVQKMR